VEPLHGPNKTAGRGKEHAVAAPGPTIVMADDEPDIRLRRRWRAGRPDPGRLPRSRSCRLPVP